MKAPSAILRSLSLRRIQPSATVAPLPATTQFSRELTAELNTLLGGEHDGMPQLLDAAITAQKIALNSLARVSYVGDVDRGVAEEYLDANVDILDACNFFAERIVDAKKYVESLRIVARLVESECVKNAPSRAFKQLESSCDGIEKRFKAMGKRGSKGMKLGHGTELGEIVCGSKAMALVCCMFLERALSLDCCKGELVMMKCHPHDPLRVMQDLVEKKRRCGCLVMSELQQTVSAARELKQDIKAKKGKEVVVSCVERVKRRCRELEDGVGLIEGKEVSLEFEFSFGHDGLCLADAVPILLPSLIG
ncbi:hypothetical protein CR513_49841, partial [Mucuna pruriens]